MGFLQRLFGAGARPGASAGRSSRGRDGRAAIDEAAAPAFGPDAVAAQRFDLVKSLTGQVTQAAVRWREWDRGQPPRGYEEFGSRRREIVFAFALPSEPGSTFQLRLVLDPLPPNPPPSWKFHFPSFDNEMELVQLSGQGKPIRTLRPGHTGGITVSPDAMSGTFEKLRLDDARDPRFRTWLIGRWSLGGGVPAAAPPPPAGGFTPPGWGGS